MADSAQITPTDDGKVRDMARREATIDDLYHINVDGKAEIVNGDIVIMSPVGDAHGYASREILFSLRGCRATIVV